MEHILKESGSTEESREIDTYVLFFWKIILQLRYQRALEDLKTKNLSIQDSAKKFAEMQHRWAIVLYLTNRFHVAVRLFSNRSQMTSKCGKNNKVAHEAQPSVSLMFLPHFEVLCDLLLNRRTVHGIYLFYIIKKFNYTEKMPFYFKFRHFDRHENSTDVILCL